MSKTLDAQVYHLCAFYRRNTGRSIQCSNAKIRQSFLDFIAYGLSGELLTATVMDDIATFDPALANMPSLAEVVLRRAAQW